MEGSVPVQDEEGRTSDREYIVTINADGLFLSVEESPGYWKRELVAKWTADEEHYFLYLTELNRRHSGRLPDKRGCHSFLR